MAAPIITQERLRELLSYDTETGLFVWRVSCLGVKAGDVAGYIRSSDGRVHIRVEGRMYLAHRLAWLWMTGSWPKEQIDHINGNPGNNRWKNLREATASENQQNHRKARGNNKSSGVLGVTWHKRDCKWQAQIMIDGKHRHLGYFPTVEAAHVAYVTAKRVLHPFGLI